MFTYHGRDGWPLWATVVHRSARNAEGRDIPIVLLHGGGPDHEMFVPLARELAGHHTIALPDIRGYGRSVCGDPTRHTWSQYADDVVSLLDHLGWTRAIVGGAGLGSTIALRTALADPDRVEAVILISVEDIEDDEKKEAEIAFMDAFAERARSGGIEAAWAPVLNDLAPIIGTLVRDAMPRSDATSIAAAAAIGRDRSFRSVEELAGITAPTLIFPGMDERHPAKLAEDLARVLPRGVLAPRGVSADLRSAEDFGRAFAPPIRDFLKTCLHAASATRMRAVKFVMVVALVLLSVSCADERVAAPQEQPAKSTENVARPVETIPSPAGAKAAEPFLFATRDGVLLSWLEPVAGTDRTALRFARYREGQWTAARTIVERNDLFVNWADFPSIVEDAKGTLFAHWLQKSGKGTYSYDVRMAISRDGGASWGESFVLNRDGKQAEHGFATLAVLPKGGVGATWLDGRKMTGGDHGDHEMGGDMGIRYATVDANGTIANDMELDGRTCECCTTGMAMTSSGPVIVYRDRSAGEVRDIAYVAQTPSGWSKPARVHADDWKIKACPVNGPQIDAIGQRAAAAWFTAAQEKGRAYVAFSDDGGKTFAEPVQIDDGKRSAGSM